MSLYAVDELGNKPFRDEVLELIDQDSMESRPIEEILTWAVEKFHPKLTISASFGGPEGMVLIDMLHRIDPSSRVFVLDTGRLHPATYDLIDRVRDGHRMEVEVGLSFIHIFFLTTRHAISYTALLSPNKPRHNVSPPYLE